MAKVKSKWVCQNCGYESAGYLGKCPECSSWSTFTEEIEVSQNIKPQHENKTFFENNLRKETTFINYSYLCKTI